MICINVILIFFTLLRIAVAKKNNFAFPGDLTIGVSGAAYQIEGAWNASDKGESTWDSWTHKKRHLIFDQQNGDIACDSYHKYKEDIAIAKDIGFNHHRLSLSWARILPTGFSNKISKDGIQYYKNVIDEIRKQGMEPFVTIYHWDHPEYFNNYGGWLNELMVDFYVDFARVVFRELGSRVKFWTTINEPNNYCHNAYAQESYAPGMRLKEKGAYICGHNMLKAHAKTYHMYNQLFRAEQGGKIGIVIPCRGNFPANSNDTESPMIAFQYDCGWMANPIFSKDGDYPKVMKERIYENSILEGFSRSELPSFSLEEIATIRGSSDYFGLNYYTSRVCASMPKTNGTGWYQDSGVQVSVDRAWKKGLPSWAYIVPEGLGLVLRKIKDEYENPEVHILENGYADEGTVNDTQRIEFLYSHMKEVILAKNDGCNIKSYSVWSLLDNFEWDRGYAEKYGIVHVDFNHENRTRTPKLSAKWLKKILKNRILEYHDVHNETLKKANN
ncbi:hypothetical protein HCN44_007781 [Aphidius gifuensis]|uniref:Uncharacterized protein n=1 Tax=Aphidius gifuensis TaxID=684658 RepID=A0A835CMC8_APHGI|nr:myrosinase 1-like [Aphidius gifuensis]KAF7988249.1 hypothetical protein HCN44_007781 [Aphidius gifuensis]